MIENRVENFLETQLENLDKFTYKIEKDENHTYAIFSEVLGIYSNKELTFKVLDDILYLHTLSFGWKPVEKGAANKYFWLDILNKA